MADQLKENLRRDGERDARLARVEEKLGELQSELSRLAKLLRGNGESGLCAQVELCRERMESLQTQWKWILGILTTVAMAAAQAMLRK